MQDTEKSGPEAGAEPEKPKVENENLDLVTPGDSAVKPDDEQDDAGDEGAGAKPDPDGSKPREAFSGRHDD